MNSLSDIKYQHNIVDVIGQYVQLKKQGKEHFGCCPFHGEKTPSFSVNEQKQFYHCFGCGAHGDVIGFLQEYSGMEFVDACKSLGAESELMPSEKVKRNLQRAKLAPNFSLPVDDKRDPEKANIYISKMTCIEGGNYSAYTNNDGETLIPLIDWHGEVVNMFDGFGFLAGGISYGAFTPIKVKKNKNFMLCVDTKDAIDISAKYKVNVLICYTAHNMKYVKKTNHTSANLLPVIRACDDDYLKYEGDWLSYKDGELTKEGIIDVYA